MLNSEAHCKSRELWYLRGRFEPFDMRRIYNAVVLPKALYGCEMWSNIHASQRAHRFCIKFMQFLPKTTSTDVALALFGINSLETEIDYRKLVFLGQLFRLTSEHRVKQVFLHRLVHYNESPGPAKYWVSFVIFIAYFLSMPLLPI